MIKYLPISLHLSRCGSQVQDSAQRGTLLTRSQQSLFSDVINYSQAAARISGPRICYFCAVYITEFKTHLFCWVHEGHYKKSLENYHVAVRAVLLRSGLITRISVKRSWPCCSKGELQATPTAVESVVYTCV